MRTVVPPDQKGGHRERKQQQQLLALPAARVGQRARGPGKPGGRMPKGGRRGSCSTMVTHGTVRWPCASSCRGQSGNRMRYVVKRSSSAVRTWGRPRRMRSTTVGHAPSLQRLSPRAHSTQIRYPALRPHRPTMATGGTDRQEPWLQRHLTWAQSCCGLLGERTCRLWRRQGT